MNRELNNRGFVPYNFDPEYSTEELNRRQLLIGETTPKPFPLSLRLQSFFQNANNPFKILIWFSNKNTFVKILLFYFCAVIKSSLVLHKCNGTEQTVWYCIMKCVCSSIQKSSTKWRHP